MKKLAEIATLSGKRWERAEPPAAGETHAVCPHCGVLHAIALRLVTPRYEIPCQSCGRLFTARDAIPDAVHDAYAEWRAAQQPEGGP